MRKLPALALLWLSSAAVAAPIHNRMSLVEAIEQVRADGVDIAYSSRLVQEWMRVRETPAEDDPVAALQSALAAYRLDLEPGPAGKWIVVRAAASTPPENLAKTVDRATPDAAPQARPVEEITIVGSRHTMYDNLGGADQFLSGEEIRLMPHIADDAFRALHRLPGVAAGDFQAPFNLRGGSADEVKVQIDGLEIIEPFHMRTLFRPLSVIDAGIIGNAQVLSGGFTAEHGNYMSGVVDVTTRRPESEPVHELGVSFVSAFARSGGQFADGRGSYFVSGRRGYLDLITEEVVDKDEELQPRYSDLFASVSYAVNDTTGISVQTLLSDDDVSFVDPVDGEDVGEDGTMQYLWLTADIEPWPGVTATNILFAGRVESLEEGSQVNPPSENIFRRYEREAEYYGLQSDWRIAINPDHVFRFGARYRELTANYDYQIDATRRSDFVNNGAPFFLVRDIQTRVDGEDVSIYGAYRFRLTKRMVWELGLRWDDHGYDNTFYDAEISPRVNALFEISDRTELRVAWGEFRQPHAIQDLQVADGDLRFYAPERAEHRVIGLKHAFSSGLELQADIYEKRYRDLRTRYENLLDPYEYGPESNFDRVAIDPDSGRAYGAEFTLRSRASSSLDWWLSYTRSKVTDEFDGVSEPRAWDQRDAMTASLTWHGDKWSFSAVSRYRSGWPRTPLLVSPVVDGNGTIIGVDVDMSRRHQAAFDSYTRLDLRASRTVQLRRGSFEYYLEIFNVFNTKNQCCISDHDLLVGASVSTLPEIDDFLPLFPSFGFVWRFGPGAGE